MKYTRNFLQSNELYSKNAEEIVDKLNIFMKMLTEYNEKFNLTAITDEDEIDVKHFYDSLQGSKYVSENNLDIGSGAGFPGIPLAIANPVKRFTLADSLKKRVDFLSAVKENCSLSNVEVIHTRAEDLDKTKKYGSVTARAVAPLNILCEYCLPFVRVGGIMLAYKGKKADDELKEAEKAIEVLGGKTEKVYKYDLFGSESGKEKEISERCLIIIRKEKETPLKYPRSGNKPRLKPLV